MTRARLSPDTDPRFGRFSLRTDCPRCGAHLPVNGPATEVDCSECGHRLPVPHDVLLGLLNGFEDDWPTVDRGTLTTGDLTWRWTADSLDHAECPACNAPLTGELADELVTCGSCGARIPSHPPPAALRRVSGLSRVIGGDLVLTREPQPPAPVALACPACGAGLTVTSRHDRLTPCDHCGSQVHLPDAVWRALHPPRTVQPWLVRFDGPSRPAERAREEREESQRKAERERNRAEHRRRESEARDRKRAAEDAAKAEADRARTAAQGRWERWTLAPTAVCFLLALGCVAGMIAAGGGWAVGHVPGIRLVGLSPSATRQMTDWAVVAAVLPVVPVWALSVGVAALRGGNPLLGMLFWSGFMSGLSVIPFAGPFFGLFWGWQHLRNMEPTPSTDPLPRFTGWPLAVLYFTVPAYLHLCWGAFIDVAATLGL